MASKGQMELWHRRASDRIKKAEKLIADSKKRMVDLEKKIKVAKDAAVKKGSAKKRATTKKSAKRKPVAKTPVAKTRTAKKPVARKKKSL